MENRGIYDHLVYFTAIGNILWPFGIFCGHLVYFVVIWYILWSFGIFCCHLVYFSPFWYFVPRKIWQPCSEFCQIARNNKFRVSAVRTRFATETV
jgi:hypothetical protein